MTDSITDDDLRRIDENVDPTALTQSEIEDELPDTFTGDAKSDFADRISSRRDPVQESIDLGDRIETNPATGQAMVRNEEGQLATAAENVEGTTLEDDGGFFAELDDGGRVRIATVDLDAGTEGRRRENPGW